MRACARCEHINNAPKTSTKTQNDPGEPLCDLRAQNGQADWFLADVLKSGKQTLDGHMRSNAVLPPGVVCNAWIGFKNHLVRLVNWLVGSFSWLVGWLVFDLVGWLSWLVSFALTRLVGWLGSSSRQYPQEN
jgi:hypothetical protein